MKLDLRSMLGALLLVGAILTAYENSLGNPFLYDDQPFITENHYIRSLKNIGYFFTRSRSIASSDEWAARYTPIRTLSFAVDYALWGLNSANSRMVNLLLHAANCLLLLGLAWLLLGEPLQAWLIAFLFALHPIQTEAVQWVTGRDNLLFSFFFLIALILHHKAGSSERQPRLDLHRLSLLAFALALISKEIAIVLPAILLLHDALIPGVRRAPWRVHATFFLASGLYFLARAAIIGHVAQQEYWGGSPLATAYTMAGGLRAYIRLAFWPVDLSIAHPLPVLQALSWSVALTYLAIFLGLAITIVGARRHRIESFGVLWYVVCMLPSLNIIPIRAITCERFTYLAMAGFCFFLVALLSRLLPSRRWLAGLGVGILVLYTLRTRERNTDWSSQERLWSSVLSLYPDSARAHNNLAACILNRGSDAAAYAHLMRVLEIAPDYYLTHYNLGNFFLRRHQLPEALRHYQDALRSEPGDIDSRKQIASCLEQMGDPRHAVDGLQEYLGRAGDQVALLHTLGKLYDRLGRPHLALDCFERSVRAEPFKTPAWTDLGLAYLRLGQRDAARGAWLSALRYDPADAEAAYQLTLLPRESL